MAIYRVIVLAFLSILLFIPKQQMSFLIAGLIGLLSLSLLPIFIKNVRQDIVKRNPIAMSFILFLIASAFSTLFSIDRGESEIQLLVFISYFIIFISIKSIFANRKERELFAIFYLIFAGILSLVSLYNTLIAHYVNRQNEGTSFMWVYYGHNHLSSILIFAIPLTFYFLWKNWKNKLSRPILLIVNCYFLATMFFTLARASMFSLLFAILISLVFLRKRISTFRIVVTLSVIIAIFSLLSTIFLTNDNLIVRKFPFYFDERNPRIIYWQNAIENFNRRPLFGFGLDTFTRVNFAPVFLQKPFLQSNYVHNFFLQMLSDAGIFGFLASLGLILTLILRSIQKTFIKSYSTLYDKYLSIAFFVGILASTLNTFVDYDWQLPTVFLIFWLIAGSIL